MKIGFLINSIDTEYPKYATTVLAFEAHSRGHEVHYITPHDFAYSPEDTLCVHSAKVPKKKCKDAVVFLETAQKVAGKKSEIDVTELDALLLRNDPAGEKIASESWVESTVLVFAQEAARRGVIVLNDPESLSRATSKFYFQLFPEEVRPKSLISRKPDEIKGFLKDVGGKAVIKPMQGSGGQSVFLIDESDGANVNQMIEAVSRDGYVICQEYLPAAAEGDIRMFVLNGEPLMSNGKYAAIHRKSSGEDMRSNMHTGGKAVKAVITEEALRLASLVRPKLIRDGMFLVGLDIAGDKLMEINVFSPGGLHSACKFHRENFAAVVIESIEKKVEYRSVNPVPLHNSELATL